MLQYAHKRKVSLWKTCKLASLSLCLFLLTGCGEPVSTSIPDSKATTTSKEEVVSDSSVTEVTDSSSSLSSSTSYLPATNISFTTAFVNYYVGLSIRIDNDSSSKTLSYPSYAADSTYYDVEIRKEAGDWEDGSASIRANEAKLKEFLASNRYDPALADTWLSAQQAIAIVLPAKYFFSMATGGTVNSIECFTFTLASGGFTTGDKVNYMKQISTASTGKPSVKEYTIPKSFDTGDNHIKRPYAQTGTKVRLTTGTTISYSGGNVGQAFFYSSNLTVKSFAKLKIDLTVMSDFTYNGSGGFNFFINYDTENYDYLNLASTGILTYNATYEAGYVFEGVELSLNNYWTAYDGMKLYFASSSSSDKTALLEGVVHFDQNA